MVQVVGLVEQRKMETLKSNESIVDYYEVQLDHNEDYIMDSGKDVKEAILEVPGSFESEWCSFYLPGSYVMDTDSELLTWITNWNFMMPNPVGVIVRH